MGGSIQSATAVQVTFWVDWIAALVVRTPRRTMRGRPGAVSRSALHQRREYAGSGDRGEERGGSRLAARMTRSPRAAITGIRPGEDAERAVRVTSEADVCHLE